MILRYGLWNLLYELFLEMASEIYNEFVWNMVFEICDEWVCIFNIKNECG